MCRSLNHLKDGESGTILAVRVEGPAKRRLIEMGITPGAEVRMRRRAPLGDPMEISLRGYRLSLRKSDARRILLNP